MDKTFICFDMEVVVENFQYYLGRIICIPIVDELLNSTQPEIMDAGVNTSYVRINMSNILKTFSNYNYWSVSGTSQVGCKIILNYLVQPELIQPCFKCINSTSINYCIR